MNPKRPKPAPAGETHCENCGKTLFGRSDKRFCNDTCRNTFNREKNLREQIKAHENLPEIFRIIKHNYQLLKSACKRPIEHNEYILATEKEMADAGFNFHYFTSIYTERDELWRFRFERGWRMDETYFYIRDIPEQAALL